MSTRENDIPLAPQNGTRGGKAHSRDARRVVVTGCGVISPLALGVDQHWSRLLDGESGVAVCDREACRKLPGHLGALVKGFTRKAFIDDRVVRKLLSPNGAYPVGAAGDAIKHAGLEGEHEVLARSGLYVGSIAFDIPPDTFLPALKESFDKQGEFVMARYATRGLQLLDPLFLVKALPNGGLCGISIQYQILGPNTNITNGTMSGLQAIGAAVNAIRRGECDVAVAGGYDSQVTVDGVVEHMLAGRLSQRLDDAGHACRPFDVGRDGFVVGEGAAFMVLETEEHARARSARIYAEIAGITQTSNCGLLRKGAANDGTALEQSARQTLGRSACSPGQLSAIFGDGLGTPQADLTEAAVVHRLVGAEEVPFTAATGAIGFAGAATGVFSLVHAALAMRDGVLPPLTNCEELDPQCPVNAPLRSQTGELENVLVWQSDSGLKNVSVLLRKCND